MRAIALAAEGACTRCDGDGFLTRMEGNVATAVLCRHLAECRDCQGSGFAHGQDEAGYEMMVPCSCEIRPLQERVMLFNAAGIPGRFHASRVHDYKYENRPGNQFRFFTMFTELCDEFAPGEPGVGLSGAPGVGKTHLLTALGRYFTLERGISVRFTDFAELLWSLKAGYAAGRSERDLVGPLAEVDVLFIDEMGKGRGSDWELGILDAIVCERYNRRLSTFFATNFPFNSSAKGGFDGSVSVASETLEQRLGLRIWSRLQEMCRLEAVQGPDARAVLGAGADRRTR
jgi:DNA replication protein DnaC